MEIKELSEPLTMEDIDFRIQSINQGGYATIVAYKDARVDIRRLNKVCGAFGWKREHKMENHNCIVSIWDDLITNSSKTSKTNRSSHKALRERGMFELNQN